MAKVPGFAKAFAGRWRIVEMDAWDSEFLDLVQEAHLTFEGKSGGNRLRCAEGFLDVRYRTRDRSACAEFSWEGHDENDPPAGAAGLCSAPRAGSSATSTSIVATTQASFANAAEFFNSLLMFAVKGLDQADPLPAQRPGAGRRRCPR
nr:hypothetical protein [Bradyrhizobium sp. 174]